MDKNRFAETDGRGWKIGLYMNAHRKANKASHPSALITRINVRKIKILGRWKRFRQITLKLFSPMPYVLNPNMTGANGSDVEVKVLFISTNGAVFLWRIMAALLTSYIVNVCSIWSIAISNTCSPCNLYYLAFTSNLYILPCIYKLVSLRIARWSLHYIGLGFLICYRYRWPLKLLFPSRFVTRPL